MFLLKRKEEGIWETLVRPGKKLRTGAKVSFGDGALRCEIIDVLEDGNRLVRFEYEGIFEELLDRLGQMPLPPYITHHLEDKTRYQTVYAKYEGSAAAPTAGLHFTKELLDKITRSDRLRPMIFPNIICIPSGIISVGKPPRSLMIQKQRAGGLYVSVQQAAGL